METKAVKAMAKKKGKRKIDEKAELELPGVAENVTKIVEGVKGGL